MIGKLLRIQGYQHTELQADRCADTSPFWKHIVLPHISQNAVVASSQETEMSSNRIQEKQVSPAVFSEPSLKLKSQQIP